MFDTFNNQIEDIHTYLDRYEHFCIANEIKGDRKASFLLSALSPQSYIILKDVCAPENLASKKYDDICKMFAQHFAVKKNRVVERFKFHMLKQSPLQLVHEYLVK